MKIAVVTGASSGIGKEFVNELDRDEVFDEIWVIARRQSRLEGITGTRAKIRPIALDLCSKDSIGELKSLFAAEAPDIAVLVNAAGFGIFGKFSDISEQEQLEMIALNDSALVSVTYSALPFMKEGSRIYQMGSLSSFQPVPAIGVYAATKAFVLSLSRSLNVELRPRGIRVMAVCPGWVKTEFFNRARTDDTITYYNRYFSPEQVVRRAVRDMKKGKDVSVCGADIRLQVLAVKLLPHRLVMHIWCRQQKIK